MNNFFIAVFIIFFAALIAAIAWFRKYRKVHESRIAPPAKLPRRAVFVSDNYLEYSPEKVVWRICESLVQPVGSVECVAYSLRSLMKSPPLNIVTVPEIPALFAAVNRLDDQIASDQGLNPIGAMKYLEREKQIGRAGAPTNFLRRCGFRHSFFNFNSIAQIADFVASYAPVIAGIPVFTNPRINDDCLYAMDGAFAFYHSILIYGVDRTRLCPDGSTGAFRVRWHSEWFGTTDGWLSFALAEKIIALNWSYGWRD